MAGRTLLVTGGSGRLAGRVIDHLLAAGGDRIVTTTRTPHRVAGLAERGVEVRHADHGDPATLAAAYRGVDRALIVSSGVSGNRADHIRNAVAAAEAAGIGHLCYTSSLSPKPDISDPRDNDHFWSEVALFGGRLPWTILRHAMYAEHIFLSLPLGVAAGRLLSLTGRFGRSYVSREDCARADAAALRAEGDDCRILDITGPAVVTAAELAAIAERITGRPITVVDAAIDEVRRAWLDAGLSERVVHSLVRYDLDAERGVHSVQSDAVERLTGIAPEGVGDFLARHRAALLPDKRGRARLGPV